MPINTLEAPPEAPPPMEIKKSNTDKEFYEEIMNTVETCQGHPDEFEDKKQELTNKYSERAQEIEIFFNFLDYRQNIQNLREKKLHGEEKTKSFLTITEFNGLVTKFLYENKGNRENLKSFWKNFNYLTRNSMSQESFDGFRRGFIGESAIRQLFVGLGYSVESPTAYEDATAKIDLWLHDPEAKVQIKTKKSIQEAIIESEEVSLSSMESNRIYIRGQAFSNVAHIKGTTKSFSEYFDRKIQSLVIYLPDHYFDPLTGEPTSECIEKLGPKIRGKIGPPHQKR